MRHARLQKLQRFRRKMPFYSFFIMTEDDSSDDANSEIHETENFVKVNSESLKNRAQTMANITAGIYSKAKAPITADQNSWIFSQSVFLLFSNPSFQRSQGDEKGESVDSILKCYGLERRQVAGNSDCWFLAVAIGIEAFLEDGSQNALCTHLNTLGFHLGQNISNRVALLRSLVVEEFLGEDSKEYLMFLGDSDQDCYEEMAKHFL